MTIVYHRTKKDKALKLLKNGFKKSKKRFYGAGVYTVADLESTLTPYAKKHYGNIIVKCEVATDGFLKFDSSVEALEYAKHHQPDGMMYTNKNDGNVVFIKNNKNVTPIAYSVDGGKNWKYI